MTFLTFLINFVTCIFGAYFGNWLYYKFEDDDVINLGDDDDVSNH